MAVWEGVPGKSMRNLFQLRMRARFLKECPADPTNKQIIAAAIHAGYSRKKAPQKVPKFKTWLAERDGRPLEQNRANRRSPISGKILPHWLELQAEQPKVLATSQLPRGGPASPEDAWWKDAVDGASQKLFFDLDGRLKHEEHEGLPKRGGLSFADRYASTYIGLDGQRHISGEEAQPPWIEPDFGDAFPQPIDLIPDELPQAQLTKDSSPSQQIIQQATKGFYA